MTNKALVAEFIQIQDEKKALALREKSIKAELAARMNQRGSDSVSGEGWAVRRIVSCRATIDAQKVREMFRVTGAVIPEKVGTSTSYKAVEV
jgi:hypothetical protein